MNANFPLPALGLLLATAIVLPAPATAQVFNDLYGQADTSSGNGQRSNRSSASSNGNREAETAADAQVSAPTLQRYRPDTIESADQYQATDNRARTRLDDRSADPRDMRSVDRLDDTERNPNGIRRQTPPNEFEQFVSRIVDKPLRRFGANLLVPDARDFVSPVTTTAVPDDYRINPGDQLRIGLTGSVQASNLTLTVDSEGRIFIPQVGAVRVAGVRNADLQRQIAAAVSRQYNGFRVAVSIGRLHGITVYVTGFAAQPGSYTVSGLSTVVNAVLAAGGPSAGGSFRSIQVRRGGRLVSDFDLYDLLLKGDKSADVVLQNGDVLFIAPAGAQVAVIGSVNQEAIYEARARETINDVLIYAGGVNTVADDSRLLVLDSLGATGTGFQQLTPAEVRTRPALRGQIVRVLSGIDIARPLAQQPVLVTVSGEVARPGRYYVAAGTPLSSVLTQAGGLTRDAYPFGTVFTRDSLRQQQRLSYDRAVRDVNFLLTAQPLTSSIGEQQLQPARLAEVRSVVEQLQQRQPEGRLVLDVDAAAATIPGDLMLENNDSVFVPSRPVSVGVFGSVNSPASFQFRPGARIGDFVTRAGGIQKIGDKKGVFVIRANGTLLARRGGGYRGDLFKQPALPGDLIFVPIDANRGEFWARLRDLTSVLASTALAGASVAAITK